ncbi:MAG: Gfo/Idh/MocA family oxidoreductase [Flavobacteriaceae bacterium]|nr:Gfo/Idh/MocA family oxidoreductase [Flavobacteriaceae bacterium]
MAKIDRRRFNKTLTKGIGAAALTAQLPLTLSMTQKRKRLGVALVGLGGYSTYQLAPALQDTEFCHLAAIVTGTPAKEALWAKRFGITKDHIYNYSNFDTIKDDPTVDIVYVVLPNAMHAEFSIRAAQAQKHVICEKPMGMDVQECDAIIDACNQAGVKLGMGYRLHSEPYTQAVKRFVREKTFGAVVNMDSEAAYTSRGNPDQWRLDKKLSGGGALMNMGCYAIQGLIYGSGENPISVTAQEFSTRPEYFKDTDETITAQFEFASGATGAMLTSHNQNANKLRVNCKNGWYELDPASTYIPLAGRTSNGPLRFEQVSQQQLQMDDFAKHILFDAPNRAPGEMGKRDMEIVAAIYRSIATKGSKQFFDFPSGYGMGG